MCCNFKRLTQKKNEIFEISTKIRNGISPEINLEKIKIEVFYKVDKTIRNEMGSNVMWGKTKKWGKKKRIHKYSKCINLNNC